MRVFAYTKSTDMRKSFDGLIGLTRSVIKQDPLSGHLFVFFNRRFTERTHHLSYMQSPVTW